MLRHLLNPNKCVKLEDLSHTVELWEEQLRLYEQRKRSDGTRHTLDEEIKISVLEHICPGELERHLQLNRARYVTYQDVRDEVSLYLETRLGAKLKVGTAAQPADESAPMDIGAARNVRGKEKEKMEKEREKDIKERARMASRHLLDKELVRAPGRKIGNATIVEKSDTCRRIVGVLVVEPPTKGRPQKGNPRTPTKVEKESEAWRTTSRKPKPPRQVSLA